jgi:hypothetical protein
MITILIIIVFVSMVLGAKSSSRGGIRVNNPPTTPRPNPPKGMSSQYKGDK